MPARRSSGRQDDAPDRIHGAILRAIMALPSKRSPDGFTAGEKALLAAILTHSRWTDGGGCYAKVETLAQETSLSTSHTKRLLHSLACHADDASCRQPARNQCRHRGLLIKTAGPGPGQAATYALHLERLGVALPGVVQDWPGVVRSMGLEDQQSGVAREARSQEDGGVPLQPPRGAIDDAGGVPLTTPRGAIMAPNQGSEDRGEEDQDRSDKTHRARTRAREEAPVQRVSDAIRELREDFEVVAIWTREDGDEVHALAEFVRPDDVTRTRVEVNIARRPSWALARMILRRVAADRRDGRDPWRARPKPPPARSRAQADPYEHLYRRD